MQPKLGMLLVGGKKPAPYPEEGDDGEYGTAGKRLSIKELMEAFKKGDEEAACEALEAFIECCC